MDDAVKKAKDKTRVRDLQQAATQQATAPEDWTGPQKLVIVI